MGYIEDISKELYSYLPNLTKKEDFDEFWKRTLEQTRANPLNSSKTLYPYPSPYADVYRISYNGFDTTKIHGWYIVPKFIKKDKYPCLIHYHGFGCSKGMPADYMQWIMLGVAVLAVDCREQTGDTGNCASYSTGFFKNVASKGILSKEEYYYRAVYMDCVKAIDFACEQEEVDKSKIIIEGASQGGGLGMAVCALDSRPYLTMVDVPSNSNLTKRIEGYHGAFSAAADYLQLNPDKVEEVLDVLSYFDTMNMANKINCKVLASVGLKDNICPAIMYFATYNRIKSNKQIHIYPFNGHEGGGSIHNEIKLKFLYENL
jgi:cephalosporin-C deacetylase